MRPARFLVPTLVAVGAVTVMDTPLFAAPIRVMTFQIGWAVAPDGAHPWTSRHAIVHEAILAADPDVLGTQGAQDVLRDFLVAALPDYEHFGASCTDGSDDGEMCTVFVRRSRFDRVGGGHFWLSETPTVPGSRSWDSSSPRMVTWLKLRDRHAPDAPPLLVCNTQFDHVGVRARIESARQLLKFVAREGEGRRTIVTGDLNCREHDPTYLSLFRPTMGGCSPLLDVCLLLHPGSRLEEAIIHDRRLNAVERARIDRIAVSRDAYVLEVAIVRTSRSHRIPSDHVPVIAAVEFEAPSMVSPSVEPLEQRNARVKW